MNAISGPADTGVFAVLERAALAVAAAALLGLVAVQGWQVVARYVLNDSPGWTEPMALLCLATAMMFGAAAGVRRERHFGFNLLVAAAPPRAQAVMLACCRLLIALLGVFIGWCGGVIMADGWSVPMAGTALPQGAMFAPLCVGGALISVFALERLFASPAPRASAPDAEPG